MDPPSQTSLDRLGPDALGLIAARLELSALSASSTACGAVRSATAALLEAHRREALRSLHDHHCGCGCTDFAGEFLEDADCSCPWLRSTQNVDHLILRSRSLLLRSTEMRVLIHLLHRRRDRAARMRAKPIDLDMTFARMQSNLDGSPPLWHSLPRHLSFDYPHGVSAAAVQALVGALHEVAPGLATLSLAGCKIDDTAACALAAAVDSPTAMCMLHSLSLEDNIFTPAARGQLRRACGRRTGEDGRRRVALSAYSEVENESIHDL